MAANQRGQRDCHYLTLPNFILCLMAERCRRSRRCSLVRERHDAPPKVVELGAISAAAVLPATIGKLVGQGIRKRMSKAKFRRVFFVSLLLLGCYIVVRSLAK